MATSLKSIGQGLPLDGNPSPFPPFANASVPYKATLLLLGLTIDFPIWLLSTSVVPSVMNPIPLSPSFESRHNDSKVEPMPSSPVSLSSSPTSLGESSTSSNQETKKNKKKKSDKCKATCATIAPSIPQVGTLPTPPWKVKFPCKLCKGDHLLRDYPGIPRTLEIWSHNLAHPSSSSEAHDDATLPTTSGKKKGKIRFPCRLCEGDHPLHLCLLMDKAFAMLESLIASSPQLPIGYQRLSLDPPLLTKRLT